MLHERFHNWEIPLLMASGVILTFGWISYGVSKRLDCSSSGCHHEPCSDQKKKAHLVLKIASALFLFNVSVFAFYSIGPIGIYGG